VHRPRTIAIYQTFGRQFAFVPDSNPERGSFKDEIIVITYITLTLGMIVVALAKPSLKLLDDHLGIVITIPQRYQQLFES
jgi:hypothetical protein